MKDKTYHVKHDFGETHILPPEGGMPIKLNINMTLQTFLYLVILIFVIGYVVVNVIKTVSEITGG